MATKGLFEDSQFVRWKSNINQNRQQKEDEKKRNFIRRNPLSLFKVKRGTVARGELKAG